MVSPKFTVFRFLAVVFGIVGTYVALFAVLLFYPEPERPVQYDNVRHLLNEGPGIVAAVLYLCFVMGWAVSYAVFFKFPRNFRGLMIGIVFCASLLTLGLLLGVDEEQKVLDLPLPVTIIYYFFASIFGAAFQMLFLVIFLQSAKCFWERFFNRRALPANPK